MTFFTVNPFPNSVDAAMPNNRKYDINNNERYVIRTYIWDVRVTKGISY